MKLIKKIVLLILNTMVTVCNIDLYDTRSRAVGRAKQFTTYIIILFLIRKNNIECYIWI